MKKQVQIIVVIVALILLAQPKATAQQEAQITQYLDNMLYYNPAYAGSTDRLSMAALSRIQWAGVEGAPRTHVFSGHAPLNYKTLALGGSIMNDAVGPLSQTWVNVDASYTLRFEKHNGRLAFGVKGGLNFINGELSSLPTTQANDPAFMVNYSNEIRPNIGAGIYYHSDKFFAGASIPRMLTNSNPQLMEYNDQQHYYFSMGGYFEVNRAWKLRPSAMLKITSNAPLAIDISAAAIYFDKIWLGVNYRLQDSFGALIQYQFQNQFRIGYAYDMATTSMIRNNIGTHEITLMYDLYFKKGRVYGPRYF